MDQGPRAVFLAQVVRPEERTKVMGVVNTVKTIAQGGGPIIAGSLAQKGHFGAVFVLGGMLKASYDLALLGLWLVRRRQEERRQEELQEVADDILLENVDVTMLIREIVMVMSMGTMTMWANQVLGLHLRGSESSRCWHLLSNN